jgi:hypothetical protein
MQEGMPCLWNLQKRSEARNNVGALLIKLRSVILSSCFNFHASLHWLFTAIFKPILQILPPFMALSVVIHFRWFGIRILSGYSAFSICIIPQTSEDLPGIN